MRYGDGRTSSACEMQAARNSDAFRAATRWRGHQIRGYRQTVSVARLETHVANGSERGECAANGRGPRLALRSRRAIGTAAAGGAKRMKRPDGRSTRFRLAVWLPFTAESQVTHWPASNPTA